MVGGPDGEENGDGSIARALAAVPADVGPWCADALSETFVDQATQWAGRVNTSFAAAAVTPEDLEVVGSAAAEGIGRAT